MLIVWFLIVVMLCISVPPFNMGGTIYSSGANVDAIRTVESSFGHSGVSLLDGSNGSGGSSSLPQNLVDAFLNNFYPTSPQLVYAPYLVLVALMQTFSGVLFAYLFFECIIRFCFKSRVGMALAFIVGMNVISSALRVATAKTISQVGVSRRNAVDTGDLMLSKFNMYEMQYIIGVFYPFNNLASAIEKTGFYATKQYVTNTWLDAAVNCLRWNPEWNTLEDELELIRLIKTDYRDDNIGGELPASYTSSKQQVAKDLLYILKGSG